MKTAIHYTYEKEGFSVILYCTQRLYFRYYTLLLARKQYLQVITFEILAKKNAVTIK